MQQLLWAGQDRSGHEGSASCLPAASRVFTAGVHSKQDARALWIPWADGEMGSAKKKHCTPRPRNVGCGIAQGVCVGAARVSGVLTLGTGIKGGL